MGAGAPHLFSFSYKSQQFESSYFTYFFLEFWLFTTIGQNQINYFNMAEALEEDIQ